MLCFICEEIGREKPFFGKIYILFIRNASKGGIQQGHIHWVRNQYGSVFSDSCELLFGMYDVLFVLKFEKD